MSLLRTVLVGTVLVVLAATAAAQPAPDSRGGYTQLSAGVGVGWLDRTATYVDTDGGDADSVEPRSGHGVGGQVALTLGYDLGNGVRLGGFLRLAGTRLGLANDLGVTTPTTVVTAILGPTITLHERHGLYVRGDAGLGTVLGAVPGSLSLATSPLRTLDLGAEVGYERVVAPGWRAQLGVAIAGVWGRSHEDADHGYYDDRARVVTAALVVSIAHGR